MYKNIDEIKKAISGMDNPTAVRFLNAEIKKVDSELQIALDEKKKLDKKRPLLLEENKNLKAENVRLKKSLEPLRLSQADKAQLERELGEAEKEIERLAIKLHQAGRDVTKFIDDLKSRCKKLSVQIHGFSVDLTLLEKEISALNVFELQQMIMALENQLKQKIPIGRKSKETARALKPEEGKREDSDLFKFKM